MKSMFKLGATALIGAASVALSACATGVPANVTRYSAMPIPAGQSFFVVQSNGQPGGLEFGSYAGVVGQHLQARGYRQAPSPQAADMIVRVGFGIDGGRRTMSDPFGHSYDPAFGHFGYGRYYGRPYYSRYSHWGRRSPYYYGWNDPFYYGRGRFDQIVFTSNLNLNIVRRVDNAPLFEGRAQARSQTNRPQVLVPNLIDAMFTGFPGRNGETVRITVPARPR